MKEMRYARQIIYCFDEDLWEHADILQVKRRLANDAKKSETIKAWEGMPKAHNLPAMSRLILVGHGVKQGSRARYLFSKKDIEPQVLAKICHHILGETKIHRISLHMCCGAGDVGKEGTPGTNPSTYGRWAAH